MRLLTLLLLMISASFAQQTVEIRVDANKTLGTLQPMWMYFGYDEPNYTYTKNGTKLVDELSRLSSVPVYIRTHSLLSTGDGTAALKWGSTNAYTEDAQGKPVYDWTILDRIVDTYIHAKAKPFMEIGFMPKALSTHPDPYQHTWPKGDIAAGWAYPPNDYQKWAELVYQWVTHSVERYGRDEVKSWYWEVWNEPNILYWQGTPEQYQKLYDYTAAAVKRALPEARVGGPASTGPENQKAAAFLKAFLTHCAEEKNYSTGAKGSPLDFVSYHAKGRPEVASGHVRMGVARELQDVDDGLKVLSEYPKFRSLPVILSEADPEGCAACSARVYPQNAYRNGPLYASYTATAMKNILELGARHHSNVEGMLTWAFEFEGQPYFDGFRTLATNGVDKPVLNVFRMAGMMLGNRLEAVSNAALPLDNILADGVRANPDVDVLASRDEHGISIMVWNYHDDDLPGPIAPVSLSVENLPASATRVLMTHYRIDQNHSNAYSVWKAMGAPQQPAAEQQATLESAGQLQLFDSPSWLWNNSGKVTTRFDLPRQAVSLIRMSW